MVLKSTRRRRAQRVAEGKPAIALWHRRARIGVLVVGVTGVVVGVNAAAYYCLMAFGMNPFSTGTVSAAESTVNVTAEGATETVVVLPQETPASRLLASFARSRTGSWAPTAAAQTGTDGPLATLCPTHNDLSPVASQRATFTNSTSGQSATATIQVYGAGLAAQAFAEERASALSCDMENGSVYPATSPETGASSFAVTVYPSGGTPYRVIGWQAGDAIVYVSAGQSVSVDDLVSNLGQSVTSNLASTCRQVDYSAGEHVRNPWAPGYLGYVVSEDLSVPTNGALQASVKPIPADLEVPQIQEVRLPAQPASPIWPETLPDPVKFPKPLVNPGAVMPTSGTVQRVIADPIGPGCGWAFTGLAAPNFNDAKANSDFEQAKTAKESEILASQDKWAQDVAAFWSRYDKYVVEASAYQTYAEEVAVVAEAWQAIQDERDAYRQALADYRKAVEERKTFLADQRSARSEYDTEVAWCAANPTVPVDTSTPTASPSPSYTIGPDGVTPMLVTPTPTPTPTQVCPPTRPAILDQIAPAIPLRPTPPADPRPVTDIPMIGASPSPSASKGR